MPFGRHSPADRLSIIGQLRPAKGLLLPDAAVIRDGGRTGSANARRLLVTYPTVGRGAGNLVDQNSASWNHVELWLSQLE